MSKRTRAILITANLISPMIASAALAQQSSPEPVAGPGAGAEATPQPGQSSSSLPEVRPSPAPVTAEQSAEASSQSEGGLADIVVTAQRRSENLQNVPIAVTAPDAALIKASAIDTGVGIARLTPNLTVTAGQGFYSPYLRGVGSSYSTLGLESSVAIYFDDVYLARPGAGLTDLNDIARVEVLKGPQGTLFGRNAAGGAIRFITNDPKLGRFEGNAAFTYGRFDRVKAEGVVNIPVSSNAALRVAYVHDERDGFVHNIDPTKPNKESRNIDVVRAKFLWKPTDNFTVKLSGDYSDKDDNESQTQIALSGAPTQVAAALGGQVSTGFYTTTEDYPANAKNGNAITKQYGGELRLDWDVGPLTLSSVSGYRGSYYFAPGTDLDATSIPFQADNFRERSDAYSQELQITSNGSGPLKYIAGAYYYNELGDDAFEVFGLAVNGLFGVPPGPNIGQRDGGAQLNGFTRTKIESFAPYAQASYDFSDKLQLLVGGRYTSETKTLLKNTPFATGVGPTPIPLTPPLPQQRLKFDKFTPRVTLSYKPAHGVLLYGTYSIGFKSGGINNPNLAAADVVRPETLNSYEVGWKTEFGNVRINGAGFYYDFKNLQVQRVNPATGGLKVENAASARIYGIEADVTWAATRQLQIGASVGALRARYRSYQGDAYVPCSTVPTAVGCGPAGTGPLGYGTQSTDFAGAKLPNAPTLTFNVNGQYEQPLPDGYGKLRLNALYNHASSIVYNPEASLREKALNLVSAGITWLPDSERFEVTVFGDNLLDQHYNALQVRQATGGWRVPAAPRTWGIRVGATL